SFSTLPGVTVYQVSLAWNAMSSRSNSKAVAVASSDVDPANAALRTSTWLRTMPARRSRSAWVAVVGTTTWKTVGTSTEPAGSVIASTSDAYSLPEPLAHMRG